MKDFTLNSYQTYLEIIRSNLKQIMTFNEFAANQSIKKEFCLIRHDVDRFPSRALRMAKLENSMGIKASYYFRYKPHVFVPKIAKEIRDLGHEIGYHYECLSDVNGNKDKALELFEKNLTKMRKIAPITTISMHGRPISKFDNRSMWTKKNRAYLKKKLNVLAELYLDIDYSDIAYINDTGRNWTSTNNNLRDKVKSNINTNFKTKKELVQFLKDKNHKKLVFQIHPERWSNSNVEWTLQFCQDNLINVAKTLVQKINGKNTTN
jgi:hypothetical protein